MDAPIIYFTKNKNLKHTSIDELKKNIPGNFELEYSIPEAYIVFSKCELDNSEVTSPQHDVQKVLSIPILGESLFEIVNKSETLISFKTTKSKCKQLLKKYYNSQIKYSTYMLSCIDSHDNLDDIYDNLPQDMMKHIISINDFENKLGVQYYDLESNIISTISEFIMDIASHHCSDDEIIEFTALRNIYGEYHF